MKDYTQTRPPRHTGPPTVPEISPTLAPADAPHMYTCYKVDKCVSEGRKREAAIGGYPP